MFEMTRCIVLGIACVALAACGAKSSESQKTVAAADATARAAAVAAPKSGAHIVLTGTLQMTHDAAVKNCTSNAPGHSLMSGYSVSFEKDDVLESAGIHVPAYKSDGTYSVDVHPHNFAEDPLQLSLNATPKLPHGSTLAQHNSSTLSVIISNNGQKGSATFKNWLTLYPDGGSDNGTITWSCPS
ncbi:MAG: hypothetical protein ABR584_07965 [Candidatus Baltobacteraceae bacterium]